jgi:O-antigen ligase
MAGRERGKHVKYPRGNLVTTLGIRRPYVSSTLRSRAERLTLRDLVFAALVLTLFVIPWEGLLDVPVVGKVTKLAGIPAAVLGLLVVAVQGRRRRFSDAHVLMFLLLCWAGLSFFWSQLPDATLDQLWSFSQMIVLVFLIWEFTDDQDKVTRLVRAFVVGALVASILTINSYLSGPQQIRYSLAEGVHPNGIAFLISLAIPMSWYLALRGRGRGSRSWLWALFVPVGSTAIVLTGSRAGMITALAGLTLVPWASTRMSRRAKATTLVALLASSVLIIALVPEQPVERLAGTPEELREGDLNGRLQLWSAAIDAIGERPLAGVGAGASRDNPEIGSGRKAHNAFLSITVELGAVGLALFCLVLVAVAGSIGRTQWLERRFGTVLLATLVLGLVPRHWEFEKGTWAIIAILVVLAGRSREAATSLPSPGRESVRSPG